MASEKKKYPVRIGLFKVITGAGNQVEESLNELRKTGFVDVQGVTSNDNSISVVIYFKPFIVEEEVK